MPNYCSNKLVISGEPEHIAEFAKTLEDGKFRLSQTLPIPEAMQGCHIGSCQIDGEMVGQWRQDEDGNNVAVTQAELDALVAEYGAANWYDWSVANWGTKWDADCDVEVEECEIYGWFDTAWSPPIAWAENVSEKYPELTFEIHYAEGGNGFWGSATIRNGTTVESGGGADFWRDDEDWDDDDEPEDHVTHPVREHLERHGLGTGG
jgi:hypothetical protein